MVTRGEQPVALIEGGCRVPIEIEDSWQIDDEWWRDPIHRRYYRVILDTGALRTIYEDRARDEWFVQQY